MIIFNHNEELRNELFKLKRECLSNVHKLNEQKNKILEDFIDEIAYKKGTDFDIEAEFQNKIMSQMASFGGQISGQTRLFKSELASYILHILVNDNKTYFQKYTTMNFIMFSKNYLETSPTKRSILPLIDHSVDWKIKNKQNPDLARKDKFQKYLLKFSMENPDRIWANWFKNEYSKYRDLVQIDSNQARENLKLIKDSIK